MMLKKKIQHQKHFTLARSTGQYRDLSKTMCSYSQDIAALNIPCCKQQVNILETTTYRTVSSPCTTFKSIILHVSATPYICKEESVKRTFNQNFIGCFYPKSSPLGYLELCTYLYSLNKNSLDGIKRRTTS